MSAPFESQPFSLMIKYWTDKIPSAVVIVCALVVYTLLNIFAVKYYGVIPIFGLFTFTFVATAEANPHYGFRNWDPSRVSLSSESELDSPALIVPQEAPFATYVHSGLLGHFLCCLIQAVSRSRQHVSWKRHSRSPPSELPMFRTRVGGDDFWRGGEPSEGITSLFRHCSTDSGCSSSLVFAS
ncbi:hypothetical protein EDD18DRAFT_1352611 [Armillaria luteobubalina]|uniref:Uncharacterized protein n=1 Tax=Armillaria luteobubalina TaxID=153913 RepID=A0AA39UX89_9AGAR|nr:hypothetical protein EDD18DRAFT_1352611 [Armillaria luteobubalina]